MIEDQNHLSLEKLGGVYSVAFSLLALTYFVAKKRARRRLDDYEEAYEALSRGNAGGESDSELESEGFLFCTSGFSQEESTTSLFTYENIGGQILRYDIDESISWRVLFHFDGTLAAHPEVAAKAMVYYVVAFAAFGCEVALFYYNPNLPLLDIEALDHVVTFFTGLVGVLLGFYLSTVAGRWWSLRRDCLGSLWGAVSDLCLLMGTHFSDKKWRHLRTLVLRYCLASWELVFMQAQGDDSELWRLRNRNLLTDDEVAKLQIAPSRSCVLWVWISWIFHELAEQGHLSDIAVNPFYQKCMQARQAIGVTIAYLNTQLPLAYVQLLASMVHLLCLFVAINVGLSNSRKVIALLDDEQQPPHRGPISQIIKLTLVPMFYTGVLEIGRAMSYPLAKDVESFPRHAYHFLIRREAQEFHSTFEEPTEAAKEALRCGATCLDARSASKRLGRDPQQSTS